jgi:hypothetical protein
MHALSVLMPLEANVLRPPAFVGAPRVRDFLRKSDRNADYHLLDTAGSAASRVDEPRACSISIRSIGGLVCVRSDGRSNALPL